jgi:hypothetical protein
MYIVCVIDGAVVPGPSFSQVRANVLDIGMSMFTTAGDITVLTTPKESNDFVLPSEYHCTGTSSNPERSSRPVIDNDEGKSERRAL